LIKPLLRPSKGLIFFYFEPTEQSVSMFQAVCFCFVSLGSSSVSGKLSSPLFMENIAMLPISYGCFWISLQQKCHFPHSKPYPLPKYHPKANFLRRWAI